MNSNPAPPTPEIDPAPPRPSDPPYRPPWGINPRWFISTAVRQATHMRKHVWRMLCAQRDLLASEALEAMQKTLAEIDAACAGPLDQNRLEKQMTELEEVANRWLRPYPHAGMRENVEILLVAIAIAMAIRTFVAQPFKIPTGSMQPTLYGVTSTPDYGRYGETGETDFEIPNAWRRFFLYWFTGVSYHHVVAEEAGAMQTTADDPARLLLFQPWQSFVVGGKEYTVRFPPDRMLQRAGLVDGIGHPSPRVFKTGEDIIKMKSYSGDHLFVDRLTYNFRRPRRGEIIVFETKDIPGMSESSRGQFYIKRLVALGGERVRIGDDRHVYINGEALTARTPHFENVYSFDPREPAHESRYSGHLNGTPYFPDEKAELTVPAGNYMAMGDNTVNSSDSRSWGPFPMENVIGRSFLVYWPVGSQEGRKSSFGWGNR